MIGFKQTLAKAGARAGLLAMVALLALVVSGLGASSALASHICPEGATGSIKGKGASLQKISQGIWTAQYNADCVGKAQVAYTSTGSGPGLEAFRFTGAGAIDHEFQFIGTDDAPSGPQIAHAKEVSGGATPIIVPVTQTAIAVVVNMPEKCSFKAGKGITWHDLNKVFGGKTITTWSQFENIEGGSKCEKTITRVVRTEGSGTTYQFKNYLSELETDTGAEAAPCSLGAWGGLLAIGAGSAPNITWPECGGTTPVVRAAGGGALAAKVVATPSSIGYAALPDAKANGAPAVLLQDFEFAGGKQYASPEGEEETANCGETEYEVPEEGRWGLGTGHGVDWSGVFGANPTIGGEIYPLCALTFDIGWDDYAAAGYGSDSEAWGKTVSDYIAHYVVDAEEGQADLVGNWYAPLPRGNEETGGINNVQDAAEFAASLIG